MQQHDYSKFSMTDQQGQEAGDDSLVSKQEKQQLTALANDAIKKGASAMGDAQLGKTEKFLGMNVDAGLAAYLSSIYNIASDNVGRFLAPKTYNLAKNLGERAGITEAGALGRTAAVAAFTVTAGLKSAADIGKLNDTIRENRRVKRKLIHQIAPVLDDIKGRHSVWAFNGVSASENEVIWAHRQRMARIGKSQTTSKFLGMAVNVVPNLAMDVTHFGMMWNGKTPTEINQLAVEKAKAAADVSAVDEGSFKNLGRTMVQATTGQIADRMSKSNQYRLQHELQPYSAMDMILELQKQVESNPKASSFQVPKAFGGGKHQESYPLEEYLGLLFIQHQRDMADLKDDYTEIREALHEDLSAAVKPIAKAIRAGDLSVMSLVRLVGERQIIKNHGRAIADPKEVDELIRHSSAYVHTDLEEYYRNSQHSKDEMKTLLHKLEGQDREIYLSLLPDAVKKDLGVPEKEIKASHEKPKEDRHRLLADLTAAVHQEKGDALKKEGLAKQEIKLLDAAYQAVKRDGADAIAEFKTSPANSKGIEPILANWAGFHIKGSKDHLGTVLDRGHAKLESMNSEQNMSTEKDGESLDKAVGYKNTFTEREERRTGADHEAEVGY